MGRGRGERAGESNGTASVGDAARRRAEERIFLQVEETTRREQQRGRGRRRTNTRGINTSAFATMMHPMASTALMPRSRSDPARVYAGTQTTRPIHSAATSAAEKVRSRAPTGARSAFASSGDGDAGGRATIGSSRNPESREDHDVFVGSSDAASSSSSSSVANHVVHDARVR